MPSRSTIYRHAHREEQNAKRRAKRAANIEEARAHERALYASNPEPIRARIRARAAANPEKTRAVAYASRRRRAEKTRAKDHAYYVKNAEKISTRSHEYYLRNATAICEKVRKYNAEHRAEIKARKIIYAQNHPEILRAIGKRRRALERGAPVSDFTAEQWETMQIQYGHRCAYCHCRAKGHLTQEHITPLSKGGSHTLSNIVPACFPCNRKKHTGPPLSSVQPMLL